MAGAGDIWTHAWRWQALMLCAGCCEDIHAMAAHDNCIRSFECMAAINRGLLLLLLLPSPWSGMHGLQHTRVTGKGLPDASQAICV